MVATASWPASRSTSARSSTSASRCWRPDDYSGATLEVGLWDADGRELASESLYADDDEE